MPRLCTDIRVTELGMKLRFSLMMFLQYAIWGAWLPLLYPYLLSIGFTGTQISSVFAGGAAGAILGPMIAGQIADRFFATEKFLAVSHLLGAALVFFLSRVRDYPTFLGVSIVYGMIYAPTLALTNSICFHHLPDRDRDFGRVRLWGTIGWIVAGILVGQWLHLNYSPAGLTGAALEAEWNKGRADAFTLSAILGLLLVLLLREGVLAKPRFAMRLASGSLAETKFLASSQKTH